MKSDSIDKIVTKYFATMAKEPFLYKGQEFVPKPLMISPLLLRGYTCPSACGACCPRFSLDYLPNEDKPDGVALRKIKFNGRWVDVYSDIQEEGDHFCRHLNRKDGRCGIYNIRPFSCDFELIRPLVFINATCPNVLTQKLYGRGWNMKRIDDKRGTLCEMTPIDESSIAEVIRKLHRLEQWALHFRLKTWAMDIVKIIELGHLKTSIVMGASRRFEGFGL